MSVLARNPKTCKPGYAGLRLTAEEYFSLRDDGQRYELIDGVVVMSPSPTPRHQLVAIEVVKQLSRHVDDQDLGLVLYETDVVFGMGADGRDLVYRPEVVFFRKERAGTITDRIRIVPDVVVEVVSPDSRSLDAETKYNDYERAGVGEYWLIDPIEEQTKFYRLIGGRYVEAPIGGPVYESNVVSGLKLNLTPIRAAFRRLG
ncbi:MAG: Uma2 family endonuclease [Phycisphaerales bacterium]|nr:Uma2 family endonuclease [Phycisphaerales bacterium]